MAPSLWNRRQWIAATSAAAGASLMPMHLLARPLTPRALVFPRDHGTHNETRTEWWYLTGYGIDDDNRRFGFQVTFFRSRVDGTESLTGRLAARHLLFAHAAITDVSAGRAIHDQRISRWNGLPPEPKAPSAVFASAEHMDVRLGPWSLNSPTKPDTLQADSAPQHALPCAATVVADRFSIRLTGSPTQPLLLQGDAGFSRKGPQSDQASFYTTLPQLTIEGELDIDGRRHVIRSGKAWLDHEWSETLLAPDAQGWDWLGMNLDDGSSLTAFQLRRADGTAVWAGGSWRARNGETQNFPATAVQWTPRRWWTSPDTGARYPVEWDVRTPAGRWRVNSLVEAQEIDSRQSTGTVYWEGLSTLQSLDSGSSQAGAIAGMGYLEMTGYAGRLRL